MQTATADPGKNTITLPVGGEVSVQKKEGYATVKICLSRLAYNHLRGKNDELGDTRSH